MSRWSTSLGLSLLMLVSCSGGESHEGSDGGAGGEAGRGADADARGGTGTDEGAGGRAGDANKDQASGGEGASIAGAAGETGTEEPGGGAAGTDAGSEAGTTGQAGGGAGLAPDPLACKRDQDCTWPPADYCADANTVRDYSTLGSCNQDECQYSHEDVPCSHGCRGIQCLACTADEDCSAGEWCNQGNCDDCRTDEHCGDSCAACLEGEEICDESRTQCIAAPTCSAGTAGYDCEVCVRFVDASAPQAEGDGLSWATAFSSVQQGLGSASQAVQSETADDCEVWVARGTYYIWGSVSENSDHHLDAIQLLPHVQVYGGFAGTEADVARDRRDWIKNPATLSGYESDASTNRVYHVVVSEDLEVSDNAVLDGFTITGGAAVLREESHHVGGGLRNIASSPRIANCLFRQNEAEGAGAIANHSGSSPVIENCRFLENEATLWEGGAIQNWNDTHPAITNCVFIGNISNYEWTDGGGGAIFNNNGSEPTVVNCTFTQNTASGEGHAIFNAASSPTITNSIFWGNGTNEIYDNEGSQSEVSFSIVQGGFSGTEVLDVDPRFIGGGDVHLQAGSPAVDSGTVDGQVPAVDLDYNARPQGDGCDMGAYEYVAP